MPFVVSQCTVLHQAFPRMTMKEFVCEVCMLFVIYQTCPLAAVRGPSALLKAEPLRAMQGGQLFDTEITAFLSHPSESHLQQGIVEQPYRAGTQQ